MFDRFAAAVSDATGKPLAFLSAFAIVIIWALVGPLVGFTDTWQLIINTGTTIITFLMVFLIQSTQNKDNKALHLKLDELIRSIEAADNAITNAEQLPSQELQAEIDRRRES